MADSRCALSRAGRPAKLTRQLAGAWLLTSLVGCASPPQRAPDAEIVPCPLNERANTVLRNTIEQCASSHGDWAHDMGPGCARVWATQFGLTAGLRRQRQDLIELAEVTAARQRADIDRLILDSLFGAAEQAGPEAYGVPALFVSGILDGRGSHYARFRLAFDRALEQLDPDGLPETRLTGMSVLLAELARTDGKERERLLRQARELAARIDAPKFRACALAAIAKASGGEQDLDRAREAVEVATPRFELQEGELVFAVEDTYVLSHYLALVSALADMAQLSGNPLDRTRAEELLAFVFSERLFDGRVIVHDGARDGPLSESYCSGCNLNALHLVDRLYGDTFKIDPLPPLPERPDPWLEQVEQVYPLFALLSGQSGSAFLDWAGVTVAYTDLPPDAEHPRGAIRLTFEVGDSVQDCSFRSPADDGVVVPLDAQGGARYTLDAGSLVEGDYDPEISAYTFLVGPSQGGHRQVQIVLSRRSPV